MRPLIQYDLDGPPTAPTSSIGGGAPPSAHTRRPPAKKRKRKQQNARKSQTVPARGREAPLQHWDDPGSAAIGMLYDEEEGGETVPAAVSYADEVEEEYEEHGGEAAEGDDSGNADVDAERGEEEEEEESRELTHEEIWDDSALIDAWNSAEAEYEAYHGTSKAWKTELVKRSPLWYNKPYTAPPPQPGPSKLKTSSEHAVPRSPQAHQDDDEPESDTAPLDFDTYIPTHDPSLGLPSVTDAGSMPTASFPVSPPSTTMVSRDEAFNNALSAMYWSGYWTAVYHCRNRSGGQGSNNVTAGATVDNGVVEANKDEDEEGLVPAQR